MKRVATDTPQPFLYVLYVHIPYVLGTAIGVVFVHLYSGHVHPSPHCVLGVMVSV